MHNAWITTAGEKMSKSLGNSLQIPAVLQRVRGIELRFYVVSAHYRSHVEFSYEALEEAAAGFRRIEAFLDRALPVVEEGAPASALPGVEEGAPASALPVVEEGAPASALPVVEGGAPAPVSKPDLPGAFVEAMDDDLGTPAAVAVIFDTVREGNRTGDPSRAAAQVRAMLGVLGLDPADPAWGPVSSNDEALTAAVDALVAGLLADRAEARAAKDFARADAIRDQIKAAGIEVEDTPDGPTWHLDTLAGARSSMSEDKEH